MQSYFFVNNPPLQYTTNFVPQYYITGKPVTRLPEKCFNNYTLVQLLYYIVVNYWIENFVKKFYLIYLVLSFFLLNFALRNLSLHLEIKDNIIIIGEYS